MVGIFLTTYNFLDFTRQCVESLRSYTDYPHKLVAIDNQSIDGTVPWLRSQGIEVQENQSYVSLAKALNQGVAYYLNDPAVSHICWIENDLLFYPGWLENLMATLESHPEIGKLGSWHIEEDWPPEQAAAFMQEHRQYLRLGNAIPWVMPKWAISEVGLHDEEYIGSGEYEDWDYNNRLISLGIPVMITKGSVVWHGRSAQTRNLVDQPGWREQNLKRYESAWGQVHWGYRQPQLNRSKSLW